VPAAVTTPSSHPEPAIPSAHSGLRRTEAQVFVSLPGSSKGKEKEVGPPSIDVVEPPKTAPLTGKAPAKGKGKANAAAVRSEGSKTSSHPPVIRLAAG
jgi:hypothetical protein